MPRVAHVINALGLSRFFEHDAAGQLTAVVDRNGRRREVVRYSGTDAATARRGRPSRRIQGPASDGAESLPWSLVSGPVGADLVPVVGLHTRHIRRL